MKYAGTILMLFSIASYSSDFKVEFKKGQILGESFDEIHMDDRHPTGYYFSGSGDEWVKETTRVAIELGVKFGVEYEIDLPTESSIPVTEIVLFPPQGVINEITGELQFKSSLDSIYYSGDIRQTTYTLGQENLLVPGIWIFKVMSGDKLVLEEQIEIFEP